MAVIMHYWSQTCAAGYTATSHSHTHDKLHIKNYICDKHANSRIIPKKNFTLLEVGTSGNDTQKRCTNYYSSSVTVLANLTLQVLQY